MNLIYHPVSIDMAADGFVSSITSGYHVPHVLRELPNVEGAPNIRTVGVVQAPVDGDDDLVLFLVLVTLMQLSICVCVSKT